MYEAEVIDRLTQVFAQFIPANCKMKVYSTCDDPQLTRPSAGEICFFSDALPLDRWPNPDHMPSVATLKAAVAEALKGLPCRVRSAAVVAYEVPRAEQDSIGFRIYMAPLD